MALTLKDLLPIGQTPVSAMLHESLDVALERMRQHDYSQLPVVDSEKRCRGEVVTFSGIVQAVVSLNLVAGSMTVKDAVSQAKVFQIDDDLLATLDDIQRHDFALIVNERDTLIGVVSTYDTTAFFRNYAQDLMLIEGIETNIREAIEALYKGNDAGLTSEIESVTDRAAEIRRKLPSAIKTYLARNGITPPPTSPTEQAALKEAEEKLPLPKAGKPFEKLSFDEFVSLLMRHSKLICAKNASEMRKMLENVRDSRNKLAHFRGDLSATERENIKFAEKWLERNLPQYLPPPEPPPLPPPPPEPAVPISPAPVSGPNANSGKPIPAANEARPSIDVVSAGEDTTPTGTYANLSQYLASLPPETESVTLKFSQVEDILKKSLPQSAFDYRAWWANDHDHPQAAAWLNQSWKAQGVSMGEQRLTFVRTDSRQQAYIAFFNKVRALIRQKDAIPLRDSGPQGANWEPLVYLDPTGIARIIAVFGRRETFRIELYLDDGEIESTKQRFQRLLASKAAVEAQLGYELDWQLLEGRRACRVMIAQRGSIPADVGNETLHAWAAETVAEFYSVFAPHFSETDPTSAYGQHDPRLRP